MRAWESILFAERLSCSVLNIVNYRFAFWVFLIYAAFLIITIKSHKLPIEKAISGIWLLFVVSTQSVSILIANLAKDLPIPPEISLFTSLFLFLCGCMLYIILITLIVHRLSFFNVEAEQFAPPYWINMGAVAISTLAGSTLILSAEKWAFLGSILPFLKGFTLFYWSIGTWWIPLILLLGAWRHLVRLLPLKYHPQYWGMVFPLGMYTTCTLQLARLWI
ncbi:MAG: tellurite resistance/C4-dicarboxylate transporter family protein [Saprospiraceae bacterium]|nr:tellurite resistance/C4-dicarboxylate transporter family protein [Saprospiraceae bacterium]